MIRRYRIATCAVLGILWMSAAGCPRRGNIQPAPSSTLPPVSPPRSEVVDLSKFTTGDFEGCPPEGSGGDEELNRLKNRDIPPPSYEPISLDAFLDNRPAALVEVGKRDRIRWPQAALAEAIQWESRGAAVEGYLLKARQQDPESCNCKDPTRRDYHLWIGGSMDATPAEAVIVEVSPRMLPAHPNWRLRILSRLAKDRAKVRISGWIMWDQEHPETIGQSRGTLWEIHPIHLIEVWSGGQWRSLDG